jgi:HEAT repeat protein
VTREGKNLKVVTKIAGAPALTRLVGEIDLHTNNPAEPLVKLPVFGGVLLANPLEPGRNSIDDPKFMTIVKDVLARGERIPADRFFSDVLGGVKDERASAVLIRALDEGDLETRMRAVELLAEFKTPAVIERLRLAITDDQEEFVRRRAVAAYADAVGKEAVPSVVLALQDNDAWVREDAAMYLGKLGDSRAIPALRAASNDPDADTRTAVREALVALQAALK